MPRSTLHYLLFVTVALAGCRSDLPRDVRRAASDLPERVDFNFDVRPILSDRCYACHGPDEATREAGLRLDTEEGALATRLDSGGYAIVPGDLAASVLAHRILSDDPEEMMPPPESNLALSAADKAVLVRWIEQGAEWKPHWSFIPPEKAPLPDADAEQPIDRFILARLNRERIDPAPEAPKETLLRRLTLDLTGLPPTLEELDTFLADDAPDAYTRVVDRLLASPAYGERWAWDWLDAGRYADTNGFQGDPTRTMWPWRDWVVRSINQNVPYDRFTVDQLAGDLQPDAGVEQVLATAFNRNHMYNGEGGRIPEETRVENVFDRVETLGTVWLGLTVNCARCHDHKFDPLTQKEYYQFFDYFNQTSEEGGFAHGKVEPVLDLSKPEDLVRLDELQGTVDAVAREVRLLEDRLFPRPAGKTAAESPNARGLIGENVDALKLAPERRSSYYLRLLEEGFADTEPAYAGLLNTLRRAVVDRDRQNALNVRVMVMDERPETRTSTILERGVYNKPAEAVSRDVPAFLPALADDATNNRLALAEWVVRPDNPLTARVTVNRYWQAFFGVGLVKSAEDFGVQGEQPSHPELLDWLAVDFMESGWDVKALHRQIVLSEAYRRASPASAEERERDPENRLLARGPRYRLPSWMLRDQALAVAGLLVDSLGGPPVFPYQPEGIWEEATFGQTRYTQDHGDALYRRTLYIFWRRIVGPTSLFDTASRQTCTVNVSRTNTPLHALVTLNDITYMEAARVMAERVMGMANTDAERIDTTFRLATSRYPTEAEHTILAGRLTALRQQFTADPNAAAQLLAVGEKPRNEALDPVEAASFAGLCSLILNLDETLTKQ